MKVHKGYKFRLEPTEEQKVKINKTLGCCRFVYNSMLDRRIKAYQRRGESMSYIDTQNLLPQMKTYLPWLAEVDSQALKYSCRQLNNAYKGFFEDGKGFAITTLLKVFPMFLGESSSDNLIINPVGQEEQL